METGSLILQIGTKVLVTAISGYFMWLVLRKPPKGGVHGPGHQEGPGVPFHDA